MLAYLADLHIGNAKKWGGSTVSGVNERCLDQLAALETAYRIADEKKCTAMFIAGDVFDYVNVPPQVIAAAQRIVRTIPTFAIPGNHDIASMATGDNAVVALQDHLTLLEQPTSIDLDGRVEVWCVPFECGPVMDWLPLRLRELHASKKEKTRTRHLMLHVGISDNNTPDFLRASSGHIDSDSLRSLMIDFDIDCTFSGDWHRHEIWEEGGKTIVQIGCLAPTRFPPSSYEHADKGSMVIVHHDMSMSRVDVPGPRFVSADYVTGLPDIPKKASNVYLKLRCTEKEEASAKEDIARLKETGAIKEGELQVDRSFRKAELRTATVEARSASSVDEALRVYIESCPVGEGVNRDNVLRRVRNYL